MALTAAPAPSEDVATRTRMLEAYAQLPLAFEAHPNGTGGQVAFVARSSGYAIQVAATEVTLTSGKSLKKAAPGAAIGCTIDGGQEAKTKILATMSSQEEAPCVSRMFC